jgi:hypothetical protein
MSKTSLIKFAIGIIIGVFLAALCLEISVRCLPVFWKTYYFLKHDNDDNVYIYVIGESSAAGEPYSFKLSFPEIVKYMFQGRINNKKIEVIKLALAGSYLEKQYWELLSELSRRPHVNNVLFIYSGIQ